jgi:hypothetical protein
MHSIRDAASKRRRTKHSKAHKDVVVMPLNRNPRTNSLAAPRRGRPANPSCRGGASSMLRLTQTASPRLPSAPALSDWISHATAVLLPVTGPLASSWEA